MGNWSSVWGGVGLVAEVLVQKIGKWMYQKGDSNAAGQVKQKLVRRDVGQAKRISDLKEMWHFLEG